MKFGRIPNSLLRNNGDATFTDVTEEAGLLSFHPTQTAVWFDFDGDGWLDLFIGNETTDPADPDPCELFRNNRDGTFTECAEAVGLRVRAFIKGVACADYDNDGWEDLYASGYGINNVGDVAADYLGLPSKGALPRLYRNNRNGTFTDVTRATRLNRIGHAMGCNFGDLDNDGWLDFYLATGDPDLATLIPNRMYRNHGGSHLQDVSTATGTGHLQKGHGVSFADLDNDGDQDVYVVMGGAFPGDTAHNCLFQNPGSTNRWLRLHLEGVRANRAAIGARIHVLLETPSGPRSIHRTLSSGASFGANPLRQEIGIGDATRITALEIQWPGSGTRQRLEGLQPNHAYRITETATAAIEVPQRPWPQARRAERQ